MDDATKARALQPRNLPPIVRVCAHCRAEFRIWYYRRDSAAFCSTRCHGLARRDDAIARFWSKVNKSGPVAAHRPELGRCWVWTGGCDGAGYARFWLTGHKGNRVPVHRFSYELTKGPLRAGDLVLHECDNRACVNPDHLRAGTHVDNAQDTVGKGRHAHGEKTPISKLTDDLVRQIRASTEGCWKAAKRFGVTATTISDVRRRKTWKHVA